MEPWRLAESGKIISDNEEALDSAGFSGSASQHSPASGGVPPPTSMPSPSGLLVEDEQDTTEEFYEEGRDQALELYRLTNPEASEDALEEAAHVAAWTATQSEALRWSLLPGWPTMDASWKERLAACERDLAVGKHEEVQPAAEVRILPDVRRGRPRTAAGEAEHASLSGAAPASAELPTAQGAPAPLGPRKDQGPARSTARPSWQRGTRQTTPAEASPVEATEGAPPLGYRWRRLIVKAQERRKWSTRGQALNYAKHGMPKNLDGPARGFGKHLGRWGWREIASSWEERPQAG